MSEVVDPNVQPDAEQQGGGAPDSQPGAPSPDEFRINKDEWEALVQGVGYLARQHLESQGGGRPDEQAPDDDDTPLDLSDPAVFAQAVAEYVDAQVGQVREAVNPAIEAEGEKRMNAIFDTLSKNPEIGDFDRTLAKDIAEVLWVRTGGRVDPEKVTEQAARRAAEIRKQEREAGRKDYQNSLKGGHSFEPGAAGSGERARNFKTYDEVIEAYAGQEEV